VLQKKDEHIIIRMNDKMTTLSEEIMQYGEDEDCTKIYSNGSTTEIRIPPCTLSVLQP
jgi:hypothetical protein